MKNKLKTAVDIEIAILLETKQKCQNTLKLIEKTNVVKFTQPVKLNEGILK